MGEQMNDDLQGGIGCAIVILAFFGGLGLFFWLVWR